MKISVIVPIYNVERFIRECIESLINQNFDGYEIILVNDGTRDNSILVIQDYIDNYENIKLLNKENGGLSSARNYGLKYAKGEYICFVDSDDVVKRDFLVNLYKCAKKNNLDIGIGFHQKFWEDGRLEKKVRESLKNNDILLGEEVLKKQLDDKDFFAEVWDDIYKKTFLDENYLKFYEGIYHEDEEFTFRALLSAKRVGYIESYDYLYRQRDNSIMSSSNIEKRISDLLIIVNSLQELYNTTYDIVKKNLIYIRSMNLINTITAAIIHEENYFQNIELVKSKVNLKFWRFKSLNIKENILGILLSVNYNIYVSIYKIIGKV